MINLCYCKDIHCYCKECDSHICKFWLLTYIELRKNMPAIFINTNKFVLYYNYAGIITLQHIIWKNVKSVTAKTELCYCNDIFNYIWHILLIDSGLIQRTNIPNNRYYSTECFRNKFTNSSSQKEILWYPIAYVTAKTNVVTVKKNFGSFYISIRFGIS